MSIQQWKLQQLKSKSNKVQALLVAQCSKPIFCFTGSGCRESSNLMDMPVFRLTVLTGLTSLNAGLPLSIMITASHNPASDNGIKISYSNGDVLEENRNSLFEGLLNCGQQDFLDYVEKTINELQEFHYSSNSFGFVGRDTRDSSQRLSTIVVETYRLLDIAIIDLGVCTTPELFCLSKYILTTSNGKISPVDINIEKYRGEYVKRTMDHFSQCWQRLRKQNNTVQKTTIISEADKREKILLDFSNGSGAVSFTRYSQELSQFFEISQINNQDLIHPNQKCGAEYFYKNWELVQKGPIFEGFQECFFFDGDSDRIIIKVDGLTKPFDGNFFTIFFLRFLQQIFKNIESDLRFNDYFCEQDRKITVIGTVLTNSGIKLEVNKLSYEFFATDVGTSNLYREVVNHNNISVFFEPNGHGGIFIPNTIRSKIEKLYKQYPDSLELCLLDSIHNILMNNSKGYGLHNMLMYYLCKYYLGIPGYQLKDLYKETQQMSRNIRIQQHYCDIFKNSKERKNQLAEPEDLCKRAEDIGKQFGDYELILRKSATSKDIVRVSVQGLDMSICLQILEQVMSQFKNYQQH